MRIETSTRVALTSKASNGLLTTERDIERERERETDRQTDKQTDTQTETEREIINV